MAPSLKALTSRGTCRSHAERRAGWTGGLARPRTAPCTRPWLMVATEVVCPARCCRRCRLCPPVGWFSGRRRSRRLHLGRGHQRGAEVDLMGDTRHIHLGHRPTTGVLTGSRPGRHKCRCPHHLLLIRRCRHRRRRIRPRQRTAQTGGARVLFTRLRTRSTTEAAAAASGWSRWSTRRVRSTGVTTGMQPPRRKTPATGRMRTRGRRAVIGAPLPDLMSTVRRTAVAIARATARAETRWRGWLCRPAGDASLTKMMSDLDGGGRVRRSLRAQASDVVVAVAMAAAVLVAAAASL